jgi:hypothetical protein
MSCIGRRLQVWGMDMEKFLCSFRHILDGISTPTWIQASTLH